MANDLGRRARFAFSAALPLAMLVTSQMAIAVPPPPGRVGVAAVFSADGCPTIVEDKVRAYDSPVINFDASAGDLLRLQIDDPAAPLEFNLDDPSGRSIAAGVGFGSGDARLILPVTGSYSLRVLMSGDAARVGRQIPFRLRLTRQPAGEDRICPADR